MPYVKAVKLFNTTLIKRTSSYHVTLSLFYRDIHRLPCTPRDTILKLWYRQHQVASGTTKDHRVALQTVSLKL